MKKFDPGLANRRNENSRPQPGYCCLSTDCSELLRRGRFFLDFSPMGSGGGGLPRGGNICWIREGYVS